VTRCLGDLSRLFILLFSYLLGDFYLVFYGQHLDGAPHLSDLNRHIACVKSHGGSPRVGPPCRLPQNTSRYLLEINMNDKDDGMRAVRFERECGVIYVIHTCCLVVICIGSTHYQELGVFNTDILSSYSCIERYLFYRDIIQTGYTTKWCSVIMSPLGKTSPNLHIYHLANKRKVSLYLLLYISGIVLRVGKVPSRNPKCPYGSLFVCLLVCCPTSRPIADNHCCKMLFCGLLSVRRVFVCESVCEV
jgi:hypothetical protein